MNKRTAWEEAASADGTTPSERALAKLARKAFLTLWSYPNVFTDEGRRNGKGDGKELCDLLVVFGNDVLLFSDKDCAYRSDVDVTIAWPRWYRSAIDKSTKQLAGAEKFLKAFPKRVFLDKQCQAPLPIELPDPSVARYYLIAVTRGSHFAAREFFGGGSSGSLVLLTFLVGQTAHEKMPFRIGFPLKNRRFVHILDEMTVDVLLDELDTVPDLVTYLRRKEEFLQRPGVIVSAPGEEDLLGRYMSSSEDEEHGFPRTPKKADFLMLPEGDWLTYANSPQREAKKVADEISYLWDTLIEHQSAFIRAGEATSIPWGPEQDPANHERVVRVLAQQPRLMRRSLSKDLYAVMQRSDVGRFFARVKMVGSPPSQAFVFVTIPRTPGEDYDEVYRTRRMHILAVYCHAVKAGTRTLKEALGVASEPFADGAASQDFLYTDLENMSEDEVQMWRRQADALDILRPDTNVRLYSDSELEFPVPHRFVDVPPSYGDGMNRAQRRQAAKDARRQAKKPR